MSNQPKFPNVHVTLVGQDGNAMMMIGAVREALRRQGKVSPEEIEQFTNEATSGDYDNVIRTCYEWVEVS